MLDLQVRRCNAVHDATLRKGFASGSCVTAGAWGRVPGVGGSRRELQNEAHRAQGAYLKRVPSQ